MLLLLLKEEDDGEYDYDAGDYDDYADDYLGHLGDGDDIVTIKLEEKNKNIADEEWLLASKL